MKHKNLFIRLTVATLACTAFGWLGLLAFFLNPAGVSPILGAYPRLNTELKSDATTQTSLSQEQLWAKAAISHSMQTLHQQNPFADGLSGTPLSGKIMVNTPELAKVNGTIVNIPTVAGANAGGVVGGKGSSTTGDRVGNANKFQVGNFQVQVGVYWNGIGLGATARDETVIGGYWDSFSKDVLQNYMAKKMSDDCMMRLREKAGAVAGTTLGRNYILPDGATSRATLKSQHVVSGALIRKAQTQLSRNGGIPASLGATDSGGSKVKQYLYMATDGALASLDLDAAYQNAFNYSAAGGDGNSVFTGDLRAFRGQAIYRWYQLDHPNIEAVGSPLEPRAFLGAGITGVDLAVIQGGGNATGAAYATAGGLKPQFFQFFSNAPYSYWNGLTIAADTSTDRYLTILNPDGTFGVYNFRTNDGNQITIRGARIAITSNSTLATQTNVHVAGALIYECNILGTPICWQLNLAQEALFAGAGQIDGTVQSPLSARRTFYAAPHDTEFEIGLEAKWGCEVFTRQDGTYPNMVVTETALPVPGGPIIS